MLTIRDKRVHDMARQLAERRGVTMTEAVSQALTRELSEIRQDMTIAERLLDIGRASVAKARPGGKTPSRQDIDDMWTR
jgi:antitoxin VapB